MLILETISDKNCDTCLPFPLIQYWLHFGSSFLVFTISHGFFRLDTTLSHGEGGFWVTLSKSNVLFWAILCSYSESQLFLSLIVQVDIIFQDYIRGTPSIVEFIKQALGL